MDQEKPRKALSTPLEVLIGLTCVVMTAWGTVVTYKTFINTRNAELVRIGIEILKTDPKGETNIKAARKWALDVIDANSGTKFDADAREELLLHPLPNVDYNASIPPRSRSSNPDLSSPSGSADQSSPPTIKKPLSSNFFLEHPKGPP